MSSKIVCPKCHREVAVRGSGASAKLAAHNTKESVGWTSHVSKTRCDGSSMPALPILLDRAELDHHVAKRRSGEAQAKLALAEKAVEEANAELERTANELDRLCGLRDGGSK